MIDDPSYIPAVNHMYMVHGERIQHKSKRIRRRLEEYAQGMVTDRQQLLGMGSRSIDRLLRGGWLSIVGTLTTDQILDTPVEKLYRNTLVSYNYYIDLTVVSDLKIYMDELNNPRFTGRVYRALERLDRKQNELWKSGYYRTTFINELRKRGLKQ